MSRAPFESCCAALALTFTLTACSGDKAPAPAAAPAGQSPATAAAQAAATPAGPTADDKTQATEIFTQRCTADEGARALSEEVTEPTSPPRSRPTRLPTGKHDEYYTFASGGHGGNLIVIGVPSMRILKYIGVFTPEPWQGYGFGDQSGRARAGRPPRPRAQLGRHAPPGALRDRRRLRRPVSLRQRQGQPARRGDRPGDFTTKQIVTSELISRSTARRSSRRTPTTSSRPRSTRRRSAARTRPRSSSTTRSTAARSSSGSSTARRAASIPRRQSFAIELPPYMQDLADAGKKVSDGWVFINSINTERAYGGNLEGNPPLESGARRTTWTTSMSSTGRRPRSVVKAGKTETIAGMRVIASADGDRRGPADLRARAEEPARRRRDARRQGHRRRRQARHAHARSTTSPKIKALIDAEEVRRQGPLRRADPRLQGVDRGQVRDRPRPAAHAVRRQGLRLHVGVHRDGRRQVVAQGPQGRREDLDALQHRPPGRGRGRHRQPRRQVPDRDEQVGARPLLAGRARCCRRTSS
jgi:hypothetical protein